MEMSSQHARALILKLLYNAHTDIFNSDDTPVSLRILADESGMEQDEVLKALRSLSEKGHVEVLQMGNPFARITAKGVDLVEALRSKNPVGARTHSIVAESRPRR